MKPIEIGQTRTLKEVEEAICKVGAHKGRPLQISKEVLEKRRGALHDSARLQMLMTWARNSEGAPLVFDVNCSKSAAISSLSSYAPGLVVARLINEFQAGGTLYPRLEAISKILSRVELMDNESLDSLIRGRCIDFVCLSGAERQYLTPLFSRRSPESVKQKGGMQEFARNLINFTNKAHSDLLSESFLEAMGVFISEVFQNTQEHAKRDHTGQPYVAHAEGLISSWEKLDDRLFAGDFSGHDNLVRYWNSGLKTTGTVRPWTTKRFFQFSIFDTGPGMVGRFKGVSYEGISLEEEREYLISSLKRHATSKSKSGSGQGLPNVLEELRKIGGLIRIRSGRLAIFNCFFDDDVDADIYDFKDWSDAELGCVEGTVVSILVPLSR